jgi:stress-induced morphogen
VHAEESKFECSICKEKFQTSSILYYHKSKHRTAAENQDNLKLKCDNCEKSFTTKVALKNHMLVHAEERPFACEICSKTYKTKALLTEHRLTHFEEAKQHECNVCHKKFYQLSKLRRHEVTHKGKYACEICSESFKTLSTLQLHKKKHTAKNDTGNNGFDENLDYQEETNDSLKEIAREKNQSNKNRRKTESPKKLSLSFSKSSE